MDNTMCIDAVQSHKASFAFLSTSDLCGAPNDSTYNSIHERTKKA